MSIDSRLLSIITAAIIGIAFIFYAVANGVPIWSKVTIQQAKTTVGLWQICGPSANANEQICLKTCITGNESVGLCPKIVAARAFVTIACILSGIATLCALVCGFISGNMKSVLCWATKGLIVTCLIMGIIGVAIGISTTVNITEGAKLDIGAASIIAIIALVLNLVGAVASIFLK